MKAKRPGSHGQPFGAATALSYLLLQDFGSGPLSQLSSAVSSANFPDCRPLWHLMMQATAGIAEALRDGALALREALVRRAAPAVVPAERGLRDGQPDDDHGAQSTDQRQPLDHVPYLPGAGRAAGLFGPHSWRVFRVQ